MNIDGMSMEQLIDMTRQNEEAVIEIRPILAGRHPAAQSLICAELTGIWLAGHPREIQKQLLTEHMRAILEFTEIWRGYTAT